MINYIGFLSCDYEITRITEKKAIQVPQVCGVSIKNKIKTFHRNFTEFMKKCRTLFFFSEHYGQDLKVYQEHHTHLIAKEALVEQEKKTYQ